MDDDASFLDLVGATNLIPGPSSTGAGWRGLVVAARVLHLARRGDHACARMGVHEMLKSRARALLGAACVTAWVASVFFVFLEIGSVLFGSGYVLVAFLRSERVASRGWLDEAQLLDAVAAGQITPGPVFTTATFVGGLLGGLPGAAAATLGISLPAFVFVAASARRVPRRPRRRVARVMAVVAFDLARAAIVDGGAALGALLKGGG